MEDTFVKDKYKVNKRAGKMVKDRNIKYRILYRGIARRYEIQDVISELIFNICGRIGSPKKHKLYDKKLIFQASVAGRREVKLK